MQQRMNLQIGCGGDQHSDPIECVCCFSQIFSPLKHCFQLPGHKERDHRMMRRLGGEFEANRKKRIELVIWQLS